MRLLFMQKATTMATKSKESHFHMVRDKQFFSGRFTKRRMSTQTACTMWNPMELEQKLETSKKRMQ